MIAITILSLLISLLLSYKYAMDYFSLKKIKKILIFDRIKVIRLEEVIEDGVIKKLSSEINFLILVKKCQEKLRIESLSETQEQLLINGYFISYPDLEVIIRIMEEESLICRF